MQRSQNAHAVLAKTHPDWDRHVLFVDRHAQINDIADGEFDATLVESPPLPACLNSYFDTESWN